MSAPEMFEHRLSTSRRRPSHLLVLAVLVAALAAGGGGHTATTEDTAGTSSTPTPSRLHASEVPLVASPFPASAATIPFEPVPPAGVAVSDATAESGASPSSGPATMPASAPVRLRIPAAGVDSELMDLGLQAGGTLEVPPSGFPAGWYTGSPTPGERGPAIIAGHVDWAGRPGVFFELRNLTAGDEIAVARQDGSTARFRVTRVERFAKDEFPTQEVYGDLDHAGLRLITCGGAFDRQARSYVDNIVVFAELTGS